MSKPKKVKKIHSWEIQEEEFQEQRGKTQSPKCVFLDWAGCRINAEKSV